MLVWFRGSAPSAPPGHEAHSSSPAPLCTPPLLAPPPRRRQTEQPPRLAGRARPPPDAAAGGNASAGGRGWRQRRLGAPGRPAPKVIPAEKSGASAPPSSGSGGRGGAAGAEAQRGAAAVHRPDLPPAEEHDADGQDGEPDGAGADQPQNPGRGREVKLEF